MNTDLTYSDFVGLETIDKEFKVPSMNHTGTEISDEEAVNLIKTNRFIFNQAIISNILKSMKYYFLKYFTAFMNSDLKKSELYYGINDYGKVVGFPYQGNFNLSIIKKLFNQIINGSDIQTCNPRKELIKCFQVDIIPVGYQTVSDNKYYNIYLKQESKNRAIMLKYYKIQKRNLNILKLYSTKLTTIIKNPYTKKQLLEYVYHRLEYDDVGLYFRIKRKINKWDHQINVRHPMVQDGKNDRENIFYWLTRFKDDMIQFIIGNKKHRPILNNKVNPNCLIGMVEPMIANWMNNNHNMQLNTIKISFIPNPNHVKDFKYNYQGDYIYCVRSTDMFGRPCCIPF